MFAYGRGAMDGFPCDPTLVSGHAESNSVYGQHKAMHAVPLGRLLAVVCCTADIPCMGYPIHAVLVPI